MEISTDTIKALRERTGVSVMQCRKALEEADGDLEKAIVILKKQSGISASKKADRELAAGTIGSYIHDGTVGAMAVLSCETDFVAKNPEFESLARQIAMQIAAMDPENADALLEQPFIKDGGKTVRNLLEEATQKFGERTEISGFSRLSTR
jgi:elongation factor Ts